MDNTESIGRMNMFGTIVQFCDCDICKAFLSTERGTMPTKMGRMVEDTETPADSQDTENIVDSMDA